MRGAKLLTGCTFKMWCTRFLFVSFVSSDNAPINVKPAGRGRRGIGRDFDIFQKNAVKFPTPGQKCEVKYNWNSPPGKWFVVTGKNKNSNIPTPGTARQFKCPTPGQSDRSKSRPMRCSMAEIASHYDHVLTLSTILCQVNAGYLYYHLWSETRQTGYSMRVTFRLKSALADLVKKMKRMRDTGENHATKASWRNSQSLQGRFCINFIFHQIRWLKPY